MFAGKTEELIRRIKVLEYAKKKIAVFKPKIDDRYSEECVVSHCGSTAKSFVINRAHEIFDYIDDSYDVIAIDEVQFFDEEIVEICDYFADHGKRVMVAGWTWIFAGAVQCHAAAVYTCGIRYKTDSGVYNMRSTCHKKSAAD